MSTPFDLREPLGSWPYDPEDNVRIVQGEDGRDILQVRLPLGIEQYELEGRPDGQRPHGKASALDHQLARLAEAKTAGHAEDFHLGPEDCAELFHEGTLYYFRYLHLFQINDWRRTVRDTARNLRLFDLVRRHAERDEDRDYLEKWRPYVIRMNAVASAMLEMEQADHARATAMIEAAIRRIEALDDLEDETFRYERQRSLEALREVASQIQETRPVPELERLEGELRRAIEIQEFERAARLRDRIRELKRKTETR